ncbi:MAG: hypothetical protein PVH88_12515 [Ignavibacteria bacterium]|jgi:hypothetical protein
MPEIINYRLQDSEALLVAVDSNREAMTAKGFTEESYNEFTEAKENLRLKELAQQNSVKELEEMTVQQNEEISAVGKLIKKVRNAARSAYGNDRDNLKLFKIGEAVPRSVKKLRPMCEYTISLVSEKSEALLSNGLTQEDVDELNVSLDRLISTDAAQENAKKLKTAATESRDEALKELNDKMYRIRSFAKVCFAGDKELLLQFKPIAKGSGGKSKEAEETQTEE